MKFRLGLNGMATGLSGGGVLSGYAPGRDTVPAMLSPGEAILTPEATRSIGPSIILALNAAASGRQPGGNGDKGQANFAGGGIVGLKPHTGSGFAMAPQQHAADGFGHGMQALFMAPLMAAQASGEAQKEQGELALRQAQQRQADAHAALFGAQADDARAQMARGSLPELLKSAALQHGVPLFQMPQATEYLSTGKVPGTYVNGAEVPGADGMGPVVPRPAYADPDLGRRIFQTLGLTQNALAQGDKSVENVAKATGMYQKQDAVRTLTADPSQAGRFGQAFAAVEGKPLVDNIGNTGRGFNLFTGAGQELHPGMAALFDRGELAQIFQRNSAGKASLASAGHSDAGTRKIEQEIELGRANGNLQVVTGPNGEITVVDKRNLTAQPVLGADGRPVVKGAAGGGGKPMTDSQAKANLFGGRMVESGAVLNELEKEGVLRPGGIKSTAQTAGRVLGLGTSAGDAFSDMAGSATNFTQSAQQQRVEQARVDFLSAVLRRESGAVISPSEFIYAEKQYFPQRGDSPQVIEQKRRNRQIATTLMLQEVPEAQRYRLGQVDGGPQPPRGGATGTWDPAAGAPAEPQRSVQVTY